MTTQGGASIETGMGNHIRLPLILQLSWVYLTILPCSSGNLSATYVFPGLPHHSTILTSQLRATRRKTVAPHTPTALCSLQIAFIATVQISPHGAEALL